MRAVMSGDVISEATVEKPDCKQEKCCGRQPDDAPPSCRNTVDEANHGCLPGDFVTGDDPSGAQLGHMTAERWTTMYNQLLDLKVIDKPFDPATAYTLQFVQ